MTPENLQIYLSKKFDLLLFQDLATLLEKHRTAFDTFKSIYRPAFDTKHKLVFYTTHKPQQDLLDHLQRAASRIDISNFFILIVCPHNIKENLSLAALKFGDPKYSIQSLILPVENSLPMNQSTVIKTNTLCPLVFSMLEVHSTGEVKPCCKFKGSLGNYNQQGIDEIFQGAKANRVRQMMIHGESPQECAVCWHDEKLGTKSIRSHALDKLGDALDQGWLDDVQLRYFSWSPSVLCNFKCRICSANASSSIAIEDIKFSNDSQQKTRLKKVLAASIRQQPSIKSQIVNCKHLEYLHVMGGEPFLWPELELLINDLLVNGKSRGIHLTLNSNGSVYNSELIHKIIDNFASLEILLSIDNIKERFEIERGGSWYEVCANIERFASLNGNGAQIKISPTVNIQNVLYLDDVCELARSLGLDIVWTYLETPAFLCIDYVTEAAKKLIINKYHSSSIEEIQKIVHRITHAPMSDGKSFVEYIRKLDARRDQNFQITHKEIFESMGGC